MPLKLPLLLTALLLAAATTLACRTDVVGSGEGEDAPEAEPAGDDDGPPDAGDAPRPDASRPRDAAAPPTPRDAAAPPAPVNVDWLAGTYAFYGKVENNVTFSSDNRAITFSPAARTYTYTLGRSSTGSGAFTAAATGVRFTSGPLTGRGITFSTDLSVSCRVLRLEGATLAKGAPVPACPFPSPSLTAAECARRGTYVRTTESGSIGSSGSGSESTFTTRITLEKDRFYRYETSSTRTTCFQFDCKTLTNDAADIVGAWALSGTTVSGPGLSAASLAEYRFTPATGACP